MCEDYSNNTCFRCVLVSEYGASTQQSIEIQRFLTEIIDSEGAARAKKDKILSQITLAANKACNALPISVGASTQTSNTTVAKPSSSIQVKHCKTKNISDEYMMGALGRICATTGLSAQSPSSRDIRSNVRIKSSTILNNSKAESKTKIISPKSSPNIKSPDYQNIQGIVSKSVSQIISNVADEDITKEFDIRVENPSKKIDINKNIPKNISEIQKQTDIQFKTDIRKISIYESGKKMRKEKLSNENMHTLHRCEKAIHLLSIHDTESLNEIGSNIVSEIHSVPCKQDRKTETNNICDQNIEYEKHIHKSISREYITNLARSLHSNKLYRQTTNLLNMHYVNPVTSNIEITEKAISDYFSSSSAVLEHNTEIKECSKNQSRKSVKEIDVKSQSDDLSTEIYKSYTACEENIDPTKLSSREEGQHEQSFSDNQLWSRKNSQTELENSSGSPPKLTGLEELFVSCNMTEEEKKELAAAKNFTWGRCKFEDL